MSRAGREPRTARRGVPAADGSASGVVERVSYVARGSPSARSGRWRPARRRAGLGPAHDLASPRAPIAVLAGPLALLAVLALGCGDGALTAVGPALSGPAVVELGAVPLGLTHRVVVELRVGERPLLPGARLEVGAEAAASARAGPTPGSARPPGALRLDPIPAELAPGTVWALGMSFTPTAAGSLEAALRVETGVPAEALRIVVRGLGVDVPLALEPPALALGPDLVGTPADASARVRPDLEAVVGSLGASVRLAVSPEVRTSSGSALPSCASAASWPCVELGASPDGSPGAEPSARRLEFWVPAGAAGPGPGRHVFEWRGRACPLCAEAVLPITVERRASWLECGALDFGPTELASSPGLDCARRPLRCTNTGPEPIEALTTDWSAPDVAFSRVGPPPERLAPGGAFALEIEYCPLADRAHRAMLRVDGRGMGAAVEVPVTGSGGVARPVFRPAAIDLGPVGLGSRAERPVVIENRGTATLRLDLPWRAVAADGAVNGLGLETWSGRAAPLTLAPGRSATVAAVFEPSGLGPVTAVLDPAPPLVPDPAAPPPPPSPPEGRLALAGEGVELPSCVHRLPAVLDLGVTVVGHPARGFVDLDNVGAVPCRIHAVRVRGEGGPFWTSSTPGLVGPGRFRRLWVDARPEAAGVFEDVLEVSVSAGVEGRRTVRLRVEARDPGLVLHPRSLDLGSRPEGCDGNAAVAALINPTLTEAWVTARWATGGAFVSSLDGPGPHRLLRGASLPIEVSRDPARSAAAGDLEDVLELEVRQGEMSHRLALPVVARRGPAVLRARWSAHPRPPVDVLLVFDSSASNVTPSALFGPLGEVLDRPPFAALDHRFAMLSDLRAVLAPPGGPVEHQILTPFSLPSPGWLVLFMLSSRIGADEALLLLFDRYLRGSTRYRPRLLRAATPLVAVFHSRSPDHSPETEAHYLGRARGFLGAGRPELLRVIGVLDDLTPGCQVLNPLTTPERFRVLVEATDGIELSLCDPTWSEALARWLDLTYLRPVRYPLEVDIVPERSTVTVDGQAIPFGPGGWSWDAERRTLVLDASRAPGPEQGVELDAELACP